MDKLTELSAYLRLDPTEEPVGRILNYIGELKQEIQSLLRHVDDLQKGMFINCVYCGHRYGPNDEVSASRADVLKQHIEICPKHPMSKMKIEYDKMRAALVELIGANDDKTLRKMKVTIQQTPVNAKDKKICLNAIDILLETMT